MIAGSGRCSTWAVLPVKPLHSSKTRLAHFLTSVERAQLIQQCLHHSLAVLQTVPQLDGIWVVSSDDAVQRLALAYGARIVPEAEPQGLNVGVRRGVETAVQHGADGVLILPADLPFMQAIDVTTMIRAGHACATPGGNGRGQMVICPDEQHAGTNALLLRPPLPFQFGYGPDSFHRHLDAAQKRGMAYTIVTAAGLQFDLDTEADWHKYQRIKRIQHQTEGEFPCRKTA